MLKERLVKRKVSELMRILKYPITIADEFSITMLAGPVLCVQMQRGYPYIWVNTEEHVH
jgi:hypothetical protein